MCPTTHGNGWRRLVLGGLVLFSAAGGCCHSCGFTEGGLKDPGQPPSPHGTYVAAWQEEQANRAEANDFTIFLPDWFNGGTDLGPKGLHNLGHMVRRLQDVPFPIVIEPHHDAQLNESRRQVIVRALLNQGVPDAEQRVAVAFPQGEGLYGVEGEFVYFDMFQNRSGYYGFNLYGTNSGRSRYGFGNLFGNILGNNGGFGNNAFGGGFGGMGGYGYDFGGGRAGTNSGGMFGDGFIR